MRIDRVGHFTRIPVTVEERAYRFLFDTGIGVNVVSPRLADRLRLVEVGETFTGQRMSGQWVEAPLVYMSPVTMDDRVLIEQVAAVADLGQEDGDKGFSGILGLSAFDGIPVTVDPGLSTMTLGDPGPAQFRVLLDVRRDGPSTDSYAELVIPDGQSIHVEVDTGSGCLILDAGFLHRGEVSTLGDVEATEGVDETDYQWRRQMGRLNGAVFFAAAPQSRQLDPRVLFQDIIHDGLIGADYLDRFRYTVDVRHEQLLLTPLGTR
jgi:hypothetical protein